MGRKLKQNDHNASIYFRIKDEDVWEQIDKLMALPCYANSRAALLNDALSYGLPKLIDAKLGEVKLECQNEERPQQSKTGMLDEASMQRIERFIDERADLIAKVLQQLVMNTTLNKWLLSSLFNAKSNELNDKPILPQNFNDGAMRYTPTCFLKYEVDMINQIEGVDE